MDEKMKHKKIFIIAIIIFLILIIGIVLYWLTRANAPQIFGEAVWDITTTEKVIALTFDDGPNPEATEKILNLLEEYKASATFFVIGENAEKYPELIRNIYENGHEIGNHTWSHERLIFKTPGLIRRELSSTDELLTDLGYEDVVHFRATYGRKLFILPYILSKSDRLNVLWSIDLKDWDNRSAEQMLEELEKQLKPGAIILLHDGYDSEHQSRDETVKLVEMILRKYTALGYSFVTVSDLLTYDSDS